MIAGGNVGNKLVSFSPVGDRYFTSKVFQRRNFMKKGWKEKPAHRFFLFQRGEGGARGVQRFVKVRCHPSKADKVLLPLSVMR